MSIFLKTVMENIDNKRIQIINGVIKNFNSNWKDDMMCSECIGNFGIIIKKFKKNRTDYIIIYYEYNQHGQEDQSKQIQSNVKQTYQYECYIINYDGDTYKNLKELISEPELFSKLILPSIRTKNVSENNGEIKYEMSYTELRF